MTNNSPLLISCVGVEHDAALLPHFLQHYLALGIRPERMKIILNAVAKDTSELKAAVSVLNDHGVAHAETWLAPYTSTSMWEKRREVQIREALAEDWVISADVDEFHEYPEPLIQFIERCDQIGVNCVQGPFIDRLAPSGKLAPIATKPSLMEQFPLQTDVIWAIGRKGVHHSQHGTVKIMAAKGRILPSTGGHHPMRGICASYLYRIPLAAFPLITNPGFRFSIPTRVHHFHWTEALVERLERRLATPGVSAAGAEYGAKQLAHITEFGGILLDSVSATELPEVEDWQGNLRSMRQNARTVQLKAFVRRVIGRIEGAILS